MTDSDDGHAAREQSIRLLARREHSARELAQKLHRKGWDAGVIDPVIAELLEEGLLSEQRFTEQFVRHRLESGYGPLRIRADLMERGIDSDLIQMHLDLPEEEWTARCASAWRRRFGTAPVNQRDRAKQSRFLAGRGFSGTQVRRVLAAAGDMTFESEWE